MQVFTKIEVDRKKEILQKKIQSGAVFIYPTDTVYGIGCSALDEKAVKRVREIKQRADKPFSVIVPSKEWIRKNCVVDKKAEPWIEKLPGPYTLILKEKKKVVARSVNKGMKTVGVRIPDHWISDFVKEMGIPIITPSANITGKEVMTSIDNLDPEIKSKTDFMFDEDALKGKPSKIIDLTGKKEVILR